MAQLKDTIITGDLSVTGTCKATTFLATSDKRLKENIKKFKPAGSILDLPLYKYDYINGEKEKIGCLAQDLQKVCPELVYETAEGFLAIEENKLVYLLLEEVKVLKARLDKLEDK